MSFFAVQAYAQRTGSGRQGNRVERSSSRSFSGRSSHGYVAPQRSSMRSNQHSTYSSGFNRPRRDNLPQRHYSVPRNDFYRHRSYQHYRPPQRHYYGYSPHFHHPWRPIFHHHHGYAHYHHHCLFNSWRWYPWGGYNNRFICHRYYANRFFDSMLGYYIWGSIETPTQLQIGNIIFSKYGNSLKIQDGTSVSYLDLYLSQKFSFNMNNTHIDVTTGNGYAFIYFYDDYGNEATYRL